MTTRRHWRNHAKETTRIWQGGPNYEVNVGKNARDWAGLAPFGRSLTTGSPDDLFCKGRPSLVRSILWRAPPPSEMVRRKPAYNLVQLREFHLLGQMTFVSCRLPSSRCVTHNLSPHIPVPDCIVARSAFVITHITEWRKMINMIDHALRSKDLHSPPIRLYRRSPNLYFLLTISATDGTRTSRPCGLDCHDISPPKQIAAVDQVLIEP